MDFIDRNYPSFNVYQYNIKIQIISIIQIAQKVRQVNKVEKEISRREIIRIGNLRKIS